MPPWPTLALPCATVFLVVPAFLSTSLSASWSEGVPTHAFSHAFSLATVIEQAATPPDLDAARAMLAAGRYLDAEKAALAIVTHIEATRGPNDPDIAEALDLVLQARRINRRLTDPGTVALGERALAIVEASAGPDDARASATLMLLALAYSANRDAERGARAAERAVAIRERVLGPDHVDVAAALNALATIQRTMGPRAPFAQTAERALAVARRAEQPAGEQTASALSTLAGADRLQGHLERAVQRLEEMLAIDERIRGPEHPSLPGSLLSLSGALWDLGDADRSLQLHQRALRLLEANSGTERRLAFEYLSISSKLENTGDYADGFAFAERGVALSEKTAGATSALMASALDQLAQMQGHLGDHASAQASRERSVAIWRAAQGPDSLHVATALNALAESFERADQIDAAFGAVERALAITALEQQPAVFARVLQTHARLLARRGQRADARAQLERARVVSSGAPFASARTDLAMTLTELARLDRAEGEPARALPRYREAIAIFERELGSSYIRTAERRTEYAAALAEAGDLTEARVALAAGEGASVEHLRLVARTLSDRRALEFAAERMSGVDLAVTLAAHAASTTQAARTTSITSTSTKTSPASHAASVEPRSQVTPAPSASGGTDDVESGWQMVIRARTVVLDEMAARQRVIVSEASQTDVRDRWTAVTRARARLANLIIRGAEGVAPDQYQQLVERTRAERDETERALARASLAFRQEQERQRATPREVIARLPPGAALVSYVRYVPQRIGSARIGGVRIDSTGSTTSSTTSNAADSQTGAAARSAIGGTISGAAASESHEPAYAAFVARAGAPLRIVPLGSARELDAAIAAWRAGIQAELRSGGLGSRRTETDYRHAGETLRAQLWDPIRSYLGSASSVFIIPDGAIHLVDFSTLPIGASGYLVQEPVTLHYILAERDLLQPPAARPAGHRLLAVGAADYDTIDRVAADNATWQPHAAAQRAAATASTPATPPPDAATPHPATAASAITAASAVSSARARRDSPAATDSPVRLATRDAGAGCDAFTRRTFGALPATRDEMQHIASIWQRGGTVPRARDAESTTTRGTAATVAGDATAASASSAATPTTSSGARRGRVSAVSAADAGAVDALPTDVDEDVLLLEGDRATEAAFKGLARGRRVLHLATHGFFLDRFCGDGSSAAVSAARETASDAASEAAGARASTPGGVARNVEAVPSPRGDGALRAAAGTVSAARSATASLLEASPLLRSGLVLAGANQRARRGRDEEDGILTAEEIAGLDLSSAQWAVLSACDTGGGDWQAGEGVVGLRRAFLVAGARTVILSLWPVIDTVASDWMAELYRGKFVRNVSTGAAVRTASRTLLTRRRAAGQSTHPIYWAGFVATGEWR